MKSNLSEVVSSYSNYKVFNVFWKAIYRSVHFSVTSVCNEHLSLLVFNSCDSVCQRSLRFTIIAKIK